MSARTLESARELTEKYLKTHDVAAMNIGGGKNILKNWLNVALGDHCDIHWNLQSKLLFCSDDVFDFIYSECCWEHLPYKISVQSLQECYRILKPGGVIRISIPDLDYIFKLYAEGDDAGFGTVCKLVNACFYGSGHQYMYNYHDLSSLLYEVGFGEVIREEYSKSKHSTLSNQETRKQNQEFLIVEATK